MKHNNPWHTAPAERTSWRDHAACRDADPELFFPVAAIGPGLHQIEKAKRICQACPVRAPCLNWALDHGQGAGIWGGKTEEERSVIRRSRNALRAMKQAAEKYLTELHLRVAQHRVRDVGLLQAAHFPAAHGHLLRGHRILDVAGLCHADDGRRHARTVQ